MLQPSTKPKICKGCGKTFTPRNSFQTVCFNSTCAQKAVRAAKLKALRQDRIRKAALKSLRELLADTQDVFNKYIRLRDAGKPCFDCGMPMEPNKPGGSMDAGHFLNRGTHPQHRFNENNVFGQRKNCNRPGGATHAAKRLGAIERIGLQAVEALEADNYIPKWDRDQLEQIRTTCREKIKALKEKEK